MLLRSVHLLERKSARSVSLLLALSLLTATLVWSPAPVAAQQRRAQSPRAALFAVDFARNEEQTASREHQSVIIEPIVMLAGGRYQAPPQGEIGDDNPPETLRFIADYYRAGRRLRALFGGSAAGTITVGERYPASCESLAATASLSSPVRLDDNASSALATDSAQLGGGSRRARRAPTAAESAAMRQLARAQFRQRGASAALNAMERQGAFETLNLTAVDTNGDGRWELIGSFRAGRLALNMPEHGLFVIAERQGRGARSAAAFQAVYVSYHQTPVDDETAVRQQVFVDHLDLNGDGRSEIITRTSAL